VDGERTYGFEDHLALTLHKPDTHLLTGITTAIRTDAGLLLESWPHIPHEGPQGSTAMYFVRQRSSLAHNERHPQNGVPTAKVIHNFGRVETVDRAGLARLVASISRFLDPAEATAASSGTEVEVLDSRRLGGAWTLGQLWDRLGIGAAVRRAAAGRRVAADVAERVIFALVAQRALEPASKLAATR